MFLIDPFNRRILNLGELVPGLSWNSIGIVFMMVVLLPMIMFGFFWVSWEPYTYCQTLPIGTLNRMEPLPCHWSPVLFKAVKQSSFTFYYGQKHFLTLTAKKWQLQVTKVKANVFLPHVDLVKKVIGVRISIKMFFLQILFWWNSGYT